MTDWERRQVGFYMLYIQALKEWAGYAAKLSPLQATTLMNVQTPITLAEMKEIHAWKNPS